MVLEKKNDYKQMAINGNKWILERLYLLADSPSLMYL